MVNVQQQEMKQTTHVSDGKFGSHLQQYFGSIQIQQPRTMFTFCEITHRQGKKANGKYVPKKSSKSSLVASVTQVFSICTGSRAAARHAHAALASRRGHPRRGPPSQGAFEPSWMGG